jgi:hypothetical protein
MKTYGESGGIAPPFFTLALDRGDWSASCTSHLTSRETAPGKHWTGGYAGSRASLDAVEKRKILRLLGIKHLPSTP